LEVSGDRSGCYAVGVAISIFYFWNNLPVLITTFYSLARNFSHSHSFKTQLPQSTGSILGLTILSSSQLKAKMDLIEEIHRTATLLWGCLHESDAQDLLLHHRQELQLAFVG
jgi:hypothetical protein